MKSKRVLLIGGSIAAFLMVALAVLVFTMPNVLAQKTVVMDEPIPETEVTELTEDLSAEEPAEEPADNAPEDAVIADEPAEALDSAAEPTLQELPEIPEGKLRILCHGESRKKLDPEEVVLSNWKEGAEAGAADLSEEEAIETATYAAQVFGVKDLTVKSAAFYKDMTGQRGNYWYVIFQEDELGICVDALSGAVTNAYSEYRRGIKERETFDSAALRKIMKDICAAEESENGGVYTAATRAIAEKYIGKVEKYILGAVHSDATSYPLVVIDVTAEDGTVYQFEWATTGKDGKIELASMTGFLSQEHYSAWATWDADLILNGGEPC